MTFHKNCLLLFANIVLFIFLSPTFAHAYIPPYWMILSRTAQNHGHGAYIVDEDVALPNPAAPTGANEPLVTHEHWIILDGSHMRVDVEGTGDLLNQIHLTYVYRGHERYFISASGVRRAQRAPANWFEPFFHFRNWRGFQSFAVAHGVTPPDSARSRPVKYSDKSMALPESEPFIRLARVDGTVSYAIGNATPVGSVTSLPGLWIKQDQFVIKKIRFPSGVEILAQKYRLYGTLWLPHSLTATWPDGKAQITVTSVKSVASDTLIKKRLNPYLLSMTKGAAGKPAAPLLLPNNIAARDFYTQLR